MYSKIGTVVYKKLKSAIENSKCNRNKGKTEDSKISMDRQEVCTLKVQDINYSNDSNINSHQCHVIQTISSYEFNADGKEEKQIDRN